MLKLRHVSKTFHPGTPNENHVIRDLSLELADGEFVTVIGSNGAGKSTLLNLISGAVLPDQGQITIDGRDITYWPEHKRARFLGHVFQDPLLGTAGDMMIEENLAIARRRGQRRRLIWGLKASERAGYRQLLSSLGLGLEQRLENRVGLLSGGQRQALTLLMATMSRPRLLLLDEHSAALDPKTAQTVLELTQKLVQEQALSTLMITHNMRDALKYGDRLIMMNEGQIIFDIRGEAKKSTKVSDLLDLFEKAAGDTVLSDRMLLS